MNPTTEFDLQVQDKNGVNIDLQRIYDLEIHFEDGFNPGGMRFKCEIFKEGMKFGDPDALND